MDADFTSSLFSRHYLLTSFVASAGVIQIGAASAGLRGLWLLPRRSWTGALGGVLIVAAFAWFFMAPLWVAGPWASGTVSADSSRRAWGKASLAELAAARNVNDTDGGLSGNSQAGLFPAGAVAAALATVAAASILNARFGRSRSGSGEGLESLKGATYARALPYSFSRWRKGGVRQQVAEQFAPGVHEGGLRDISHGIARMITRRRPRTPRDGAPRGRGRP